MAFITYKINGEKSRKDISWQGEKGLSQFTIGSDKNSALQLPGQPDILPSHAFITRARAPVSYVLLDQSKGNTKVNGLPVWKLKVIRHLDRILIGKVELIFYEIQSKTLDPGDKEYIGKHSSLYGTKSDTVHAGDEVVICRCGAVVKRAHWFQLTRCSIEGCWYPVRRLISRTLTSHIYFEILKDDSELLGKKCPGQQPRDQEGFKKYDDIIRCPNCSTPYHMECWLFHEVCPACKNFNIRSVVDKYLFGKDSYIR